MYYYHDYGIGHMLVSAIIHGLIYGLIFRIFRLIGLPGSLLFTVLIIAALWFWLGRKSRGIRL